MADGDIEKVRMFLASLHHNLEMSVDEMRHQLDQAAAFFPLSEGTSVEEVDSGGVPGEWIKNPEARDNVAILWLHGGGYVIGSLTSHRHVIAAISKATHAPALSLQYRLAPEYPFPAALDDAVTGYEWLVNKGIAPNRIAFAGGSAGGGLAVATMLALRDSDNPLPAMGLLISPWVDLSLSSESYMTKANTDPLLNFEQLQQWASMYLRGRDPKTPLASPLFADLSGLPPFLIHVGSEEVLLDEAIGLDRRAKESGVASTLEIWEDMIHDWHFFWPMLEEGRDAIERIGEYFKTHT